MTDVSLLPRNATPVERAIEDAIAPVDRHAPLHTLALPNRIPAALLPWLAWGDDVPHWPSAESVRRDVVARSHRLHGLIGTAQGLREGARLTGARCRRIDAPPAKTFLGGRDAAARRRWLDAQPQLRLYPRRARSAAQGLQLGHDAPGAASPARTDAVFRATLRATLVHRGEETELTAREWETGTAVGNARLVVTRRAAAQGLHLGRDAPGAAQLAHTRTAQRLWSVEQTAYRHAVHTLRSRTLAAGFEPLSADVDFVAERGPLGARACPVWHAPAFDRAVTARDGVYLGSLHPARTMPETRLFWQTTLHDPEIAAPLTGGLAFVGLTRLDLPPFHVEAQIAPAHARDEGALLSGAGPHFPARRATAARLKTMLDSLAWFRACADRILIDPRTHERVRVNPTLRAGSVLAGHIVERTY